MLSARSVLCTARSFHKRVSQPATFASRCSSTDSSSKTDTLGVTELANTLAEEHDLSKAQAKRIITKMFDVISESLKDKKKISIANFGAFSIRHSEARKGTNPNTGELIVIPARERVKFTAFKALKAHVNK